MYVSSQLFFKTPNKTPKFQENPRKMQFTAICRSKSQNCSLQCPSLGHPMEPLKLNLWGKTAVDKLPENGKIIIYLLKLFVHRIKKNSFKASCLCS